MAEYHVGCGLAGIYAGRLKKNRCEWIDKSDVKDEAFAAVAQYCIEHNEGMTFNYDGKRYRLEVKAESDVEE